MRFVVRDRAGCHGGTCEEGVGQSAAGRVTARAACTGSAALSTIRIECATLYLRPGAEAGKQPAAGPERAEQAAAGVAGAALSQVAGERTAADRKLSGEQVDGAAADAEADKDLPLAAGVAGATEGLVF